jgi:hypothetical protein
MTVQERIRSFLRGLLYENGTPSRTGLSALALILVPLVAVLVLTAYLVITGKTFSYYKDFLDAVQWLVTSGGGLLGANKLILNKYGAPDGQPYVKNPSQGDEQNGK